MMSPALLTVVLSLVPSDPHFPVAQRIVLIPQMDSDDEVIVETDLPPVIAKAFREDFGCDARVAFIYRRFWFARPGIDLWTWNGRFALYDGGAQCWDVRRETLDEMLGAERASSLYVPWRYRLPSGLAALIGIVGLCVALAHLQKRKSRRFAALMKEDRYLEALQAYVAQLKELERPTLGQRQDALTAAANGLVQIGVSPRQAKSNLRLMVGTIERQQADLLRKQAFELAEDRDWEAAAAHFQQAADLMQAWNAESVKFLQGRVDWCRRERARAATGQEAPSGPNAQDDQ
jgi:hypothetical protein